MNGFTWQQARHLALVYGQRIRRETWAYTYGMFYSATLRLWILEESYLVYRVLECGDMKAADFLGVDWTNEGNFTNLLDPADNKQVYATIPPIPANRWGGVGNPTGPLGMGFGAPATPLVKLVPLHVPPSTPDLNRPQEPEEPGDPPVEPDPVTITSSGTLVHRHSYSMGTVGGESCYIVGPSHPNYLHYQNTQALTLSVTVTGGNPGVGSVWLDFDYLGANGSGPPSTKHIKSIEKGIAPGQTVTWAGLGIYSIAMQPDAQLTGTITYQMPFLDNEHPGARFTESFTVAQRPYCEDL